MEVSGEKLPAPIVSQQTEYLSWYDGPVALITKENKDEVIVMTGEELLYRNEVYGFQVKLGKAWKGVRIYQKQHPWFPNQEGTVHPYLSFEMRNPDYTHLRWDVVGVEIMTSSTYEKLYELCKENLDWMCDPSYYEKARKNNTYYIIVWWNEQHDALYETFYPYLECEDVMIDFHINTVLLQKNSFFLIGKYLIFKKKVNSLIMRDFSFLKKISHFPLQSSQVFLDFQ